MKIEDEILLSTEKTYQYKGILLEAFKLDLVIITVSLLFLFPSGEFQLNSQSSPVFLLTFFLTFISFILSGKLASEELEGIRNLYPQTNPKTSNESKLNRLSFLNNLLIWAYITSFLVAFSFKILEEIG